MGQQNSYFVIQIEEDGTYLNVFPACDGGKSVTLEEVMTYLSVINFEDYNREMLAKELKGKREQVVIKLSDTAIRPVNECLSVVIDDADMEAVVRFYPPSNKGQKLKKEELLLSLDKNKVKYGIDHDMIDEWLLDRVYNMEYIVAKGLEPVQGKNANINYCFNTSLNMQPKINEDGTVDFHHLDNIEHVSAGDRIAFVDPAESGTNGMTVSGKVLPAAKVKSQKMKHGRNVTISEDGLNMYSEVSGHVYLVDGKVFVSNIYEVLADVDSSTGDIEYNGDIHVKGNVKTGYSLKATGQIIVQGVVEGGKLESEGPIVIVGGIQGGSKAEIISASSVTVKFIENAKVTAGGDVNTEAILHSNVSASGKIKVEGKKGLIIGGEIKASESISFKIAGSAMGAFTLLEVGMDPALLEEYRVLESEIAEGRKEYKKYTDILTTYRTKLASGTKFSPDQIASVKKMVGLVKQLEQDYAERIEKREEYGNIIMKSNRGKVAVEDKVYPGVKIVISNATMIVKEIAHYCAFYKDGEDVRSKPL